MKRHDEVSGRAGWDVRDCHDVIGLSSTLAATSPNPPRRARVLPDMIG